MVLFETEMAKHKGMNYLTYVQMCLKQAWIRNPANGCSVEVLRPLSPVLSLYFSKLSDAREYVDDLYDDIKRA
jgi:hypothetical protein